MITIDVSGIEEATDRLEALQSALDEPVYEQALGAAVGDAINADYNAQGRPVAWKKRKDPSGAWPVLDKTGRKRDTEEHSARYDGMIPARAMGLQTMVIHTTDYGRAHQEGTRRLPKRAVELPPADQEAMARVIEKKITEQVQ